MDLDTLVQNGFDTEHALEILAEVDDLEMVALPDPLEFLMEGVGLTENEAVDLLCELDGPPVQNAFASAAQRKWYFANLGKKGGPVAKSKGGRTAGGKFAAIANEKTTAPPPGKYFSPDVNKDSNKDGVTDAARVGVPANSVPPPPKVPRLPNLTKAERKVESDFANAFEKDPDGMAKRYLKEIAGTTNPPKFETDAAKMLTKAWNDPDLAKQSQKRAMNNTALHQTANAITKRAALQHMDTMKPGEEIVITAGGCGAGKGYALKNNPEAKARVEKAGMVWDSAGDQNATENTWLLAEAQKRGLKVHVAHVHADPKFQWADPGRGVVKRAADPTDGRMVDATVFADSYAVGGKNMNAFYEANKNNPNVSFTFFDATKPNAQGFPSTVDRIPKEALNIDAAELRKFAMNTIATGGDSIPAHIKRGATLGERIWAEQGAK